MIKLTYDRTFKREDEKWRHALLCSFSSPLDLLGPPTLENTGLKVSHAQRVDRDYQKYMILRMFLKKTSPVFHGYKRPTFCSIPVGELMLAP